MTVNGEVVNEEAVRRLVEAEAKRKAYRDAYNQRPDVVAKRRAYMQRRAEVLKVARAVYEEARRDPELAVRLGLGVR